MGNNCDEEFMPYPEDTHKKLELTSSNQRSMKYISYPEGGRGNSRNFSVGCVAVNVKFLCYKGIFIGLYDGYQKYLSYLNTGNSLYIKIPDCYPKSRFLYPQ